MAVALKIHFPSNGQTKAMRFSMDVAIQQIISEIKEKINFDGADHGLFQPEVVGKTKPRWLKENHTLLFYSIGQDVRRPIPSRAPYRRIFSSPPVRAGAPSLCSSVLPSSSGEHHPASLRVYEIILQIFPFLFLPRFPRRGVWRSASTIHSGPN